MISTSTKASRKEWVGLGVLTVPALLVSMDLSVLFMAAPRISAELEPSAGQLLWIMDIYGFLMAGLLITMGTLGDRIGRRRLLMLGAVAFGGASLLAAISTSPEMLILARALLGVGGATLAPSTLALIRNMFRDDVQRRTAVAVWTAAFGAGVPIGSIIGGLLVEHFWWGSVFLINIPVMALLLILAPLLLPEHSDPHPGRFDLLGAALSMAAILAGIWGLKKLAEDGPAALPFVAIAAGLVMGYLFVRRQRAAVQPLIDLRLFRRPAFSAAIGSNVVLTVASAGVSMLVVQHLQLVLGYRPFVAALWMVPMVGMTMAGIVVGTVIVRRLRPGSVIGAGLACAAVGFGLLTRLEADDTVGAILTGYSVLGFGMGMVITLAYNLVVATAPPQKAGAAAALNETGTELGGALGIAFLGSIATAVYERDVTAALPADLPAGAADAVGSTLGEALGTAEQLPGQLAGPVVQAATTAFTNGINAAAVVGAGLLAVSAVVAVVALRGVRIDDDHSGGQGH
ncbi:MFS transporter [Streptomyces sp. MP131-18]|uniref:MFS transporter n=1 Tax=Streptomyces sp. MP131-18 TaxID=1857892 RepID=UPI00097C7314|nr:MFS transporter [Streptomyces sp. MP131-18]ONK11734.1 Antiseptic resistance protein [Streptomyces sp. MP131-18]